MPRTKLHRTVAKHKARSKTQKPKGASAGTAHTLDVKQIDWSSFVNPFSLPEGAQIYEPQ